MVTRIRRPNSRDRLRKVPLSFYAEPDDYAALKEMSLRTGVPQQVFLRRGLKWVLRNNDSAVDQRSIEALQRRTKRNIEKLASLQRVWVAPAGRHRPSSRKGARAGAAKR